MVIMSIKAVDDLGTHTTANIELTGVEHSKSAILEIIAKKSARFLEIPSISYCRTVSLPGKHHREEFRGYEGITDSDS